VLALAAHILDALGLGDKTMLELNTLGDTESRTAYRKVLVEFLEKHLDKLSEDSRQRLSRNPLRVLDSKDERDKKIVADAPLFSDYLSDQARAFFDEVRAGLDRIGIPYKVNPRLVRGLDYYCHTAFEFTTDALGAQGTVLAGGRYDGLIETMGGAATAGVGWAAGVERLAMLAGEPPAAPRPVAVVPLGAAAEAKAQVLAQELRRSGVAADLGYSGNLARRLKRANRINARAAVIIGDDELAKGVATVRDLDSGTQETVPLAAIAERFRSQA
jgi:histidyl-tRNA synthetase